MAVAQHHAFSTGSFTPAGFADALRRFGEDLNRPIVNAMRRGLTYARSLAVNNFQRRGIGRRIWGHVKGKDARALFKRTRVTHRGDVFIGGLWAKGLPALQETGGSTRAHVIKPKNRKRLVMRTGQGPGKPIGGKAGVMHPGSRVPALPVMADALRAAAPRIQAEMDKEIQKFAVARKVA